MIGVLKILTPKVLKAIMKYVFEENALDQQMGSVRARLDKLEKDTHPKRDFVLCGKCNDRIKNYEGTD